MFAFATKRWIAALLLVLVPLQMSFAAVHGYLEHPPEVSAAVGLLHTHYSGNDGHVSPNSDIAGDHDDDNAPIVGDVPDEGSGHMHLGYAHPVSTPYVVSKGESAACMTSEPSFSYSISPRRLDRPPLRARL